jgi:hypothetical protein
MKLRTVTGRANAGGGQRVILTEIHLCHACSYQEIEDGNARAGGDLSRLNFTRSGPREPPPPPAPLIPEAPAAPSTATACMAPPMPPPPPLSPGGVGTVRRGGPNLVRRGAVTPRAVAPPLPKFVLWTGVYLCSVFVLVTKLRSATDRNRCWLRWRRPRWLRIAVLWQKCLPSPQWLPPGQMRATTRSSSRQRQRQRQRRSRRKNSPWNGCCRSSERAAAR